jgi:hypothetical protein
MGAPLEHLIKARLSLLHARWRRLHMQARQALGCGFDHSVRWRIPLAGKGMSRQFNEVWR